MKLSKRLLRLIIFLALSIFSIGLILYLTANRETLKALTSIKGTYLFILAGIWLFAITMDASAIMFFVSGTDEKIRLWNAYKAAAIRIFFNLVTPFSAGGQPVMIYTLSKERIPGGKASSIVIMKLISLAAFNLLGGITAFVFFHEYISDIAALNTAFFIAGIVLFFIITSLIVVLMNPHLIIPFIEKLGIFLHRLKVIKDVKVFHKKVIKEARHARKSFRQYFGHGFGFFLAGTLSSGLMYFAELLMLWIILRGFGVELQFIEGITLSALLFFLLGFMPTPGSAGLGEAIFIVIFAGTVPKYLLGVAVLVWRLFHRYLSGIGGAFFSAGYFTRIIVRDSD